ncbi:hypothetical protein D0N73_09715 [Pseudomonas fluorescens]|jgi:hypothetical protein|uniref:Uncharacterized protein n=2 Tax=Pseudomonas fluorescens TaxID=294 RepID=A0ABY1TDB6_PSEFL|nr:hypothetical protein D0N73_09715 [Pseudomonas fluorescens]SNY09267.1 hypothetical protein SAMN04488487_2404 [Pseudomonas fluorescens]SQF88939.1 Uncharacterised protein [Pseudomonas fluorescens]
MAVSHRRWAQSYARAELCVNFVNRLYLGEKSLSGALQGLHTRPKNPPATSVRYVPQAIDSVRTNSLRIRGFEASNDFYLDALRDSNTGSFKTFTLPMRERALQFCISSHNARISSSLSNPTG